MRVLMIGDVVGNPGRECVRDLLPRVKENFEIDLTIANGENLAGGTGFNEKTAKELFSYGVDILTMGNHVWDKKEAISYIKLEQRIVRPINYPPGVPGQGLVMHSVNGIKVAVINASGRIFMPSLDCPFRGVDQAVNLAAKETPIIFVDFHAEATSEKIAMGRYLDGRVSAVFGTHTHVQTADERILSAGTAYISDVGMTGPYESVLGVNPETILEKFLTQMPARFDVADTGPSQFNAVVVDIDEMSGKCTNILRIFDIHEV
jgi:2',3'-cyclic-nucleotide 2'-phosphodiesterase